jgi:hypothetical protein
MEYITPRIKTTESGSVVVEHTYDIDGLITKMKEKSKERHYPRYENLFEPSCVVRDDKYNHLRLKTDVKEGGLMWITADKVYVPYNEVLLRECMVKAIAIVVASEERLAMREGRDWVATIHDKAAQLYWDSDYYKTNYMRVSEEWSAKCKALFDEPAVIKRCEEAESKVERLTGKRDDAINAIDRLLADLPKSISQKVRSDIESIKYTLRR